MPEETLEAAVRKEAMRIIKKAAHLMCADMKIRCPVDKGILRGSITVDDTQEDKVIIGTPVFYGPHVEFLYNEIKTMWPAKAKRGGQAETTLPFMRPVIWETPKYLEMAARA